MSMKTDIDKLTADKALAEKDSMAKTLEIQTLEIQIKDDKESANKVIYGLKTQVDEDAERIAKVCDIKDKAIEEKNLAVEELDSAKLALKQPAYADAALVGDTETLDMVGDGNLESAPDEDSAKLVHFKKMHSIMDPDEKEAYRSKYSKEIEAETAIVVKNA